MEAVNCKLSIITINLDNKDGLQKTIDSVESQTFKNFEWIIIDGGSTDGSKELIAQYSTQLSYWVSEPDNGLYNAMNKGIKVSNGEYLLFLNSGDYLYNNEVLSRVIPLLNGKDFYVGDELRSDGFLWRPNILSPLRLYHTMCTMSLPHQSTFIHRKVFEKYGYYREDLVCASDWALFYKALVMSNASIDRLHFVITVFDTSGISQTEISEIEQQQVYSEIPNVNTAVQFYYQNYEIVEALKKNSLVFFLFRVYFYLYRRWTKQS